MPTTTGPTPVPALASVTAYAPPQPETAIDLNLAKNEGSLPSAKLLRTLTPDVLRAYPDNAALEAALAQAFGLTPRQVLITAGADEALDRICRAYLPGRELLVATPTFVMLPRYAALAGGTQVEVPWLNGPFPRAELLAQVSAQTGVVAVVSPNNPTGLAASADDLRALSAAAPHALLLVDAAYAEFGEDLTSVALTLPNAVVTRTFSKAWGLAGLRVGYTLGPPELIDVLRRAGSPFPVSGPSLALAGAALRDPARRDAYVAQVRRERTALAALARDLGAEAQPGQGNFVLIRGVDASATTDGFARQGIAIRRFPDVPGLEAAVRITCPGDPAVFARVEQALRAALGQGPDAPRPAPTSSRRVASVERTTKETSIALTLDLDGTGEAEVSTGIGFLDHMLSALARHARFDLRLTCAGDLEVDDHHTAEDCALALGAALDQALGERRGIARFGSALAPLDEALVRAVVDLSGRPHPAIDLPFRRERLGRLATENVVHVFQSLAIAARCALHVDLLKGENDHHKAEAAFKAVALALRQAVASDGDARIPSTKGVL